MQLGVIPTGRFSGAFPSRKDVSTSVSDVTRRETRQGSWRLFWEWSQEPRLVWFNSWCTSEFACVWVNIIFIF